MLRHSLIAATVAVATLTSATTIALAQTQASAHHRTIVHHMYNDETAPAPVFGPYNAPYYVAHYGPAAPVAAAADAAGATACFALSLVGAC
jgi:hypothetical protein